MKKSELKAIIKECLVELLNEGLTGAIKVTPALQTSAVSPRPGLKEQRARNPRMQSEHDRVIQEIVNNSTTDPMMASILTETARTTMQAQSAGENRPAAPPGSDRAQQIAAQAAPEELFGAEDVGKWAKLAF